MRMRNLVVIAMLLSLTAWVMAVEPAIDEEPLRLWLQAKCQVDQGDITFSWNDVGFILAYGKDPVRKCPFKILARVKYDDGTVMYEVLQELSTNNRFYIVYIDVRRNTIHELACWTFKPGSAIPSGDFEETVYKL